MAPQGTPGTPSVAKGLHCHVDILVVVVLAVGKAVKLRLTEEHSGPVGQWLRGRGKQGVLRQPTALNLCIQTCHISYTK